MFIVSVLLWWNNIFKATYKKNHWSGGLAHDFQVSPWLSRWQMWWQTGKHSVEAIAKTSPPDVWAKFRVRRIGVRLGLRLAFEIFKSASCVTLHPIVPHPLQQGHTSQSFLKQFHQLGTAHEVYGHVKVILIKVTTYTHVGVFCSYVLCFETDSISVV